MDGFNPYTNKESGKRATVGAIYLVCLNLLAGIRHDVVNMFLVGVIPGPHEPSKEQINHILRPLVDDLLQLWHFGYFLTSTTNYPLGRLIRGAVVPLICDLPATRQMSGFAGHSSNNFCSFCTQKSLEIDNLDHKTWKSCTQEEHRHIAEEWRDATSEDERATLYASTGIRWSELLRLPYWDPTRFVTIDSMHGFFLRMFQRHCRQVWGMGIDLADGDYPTFSQDKYQPSKEALQTGFQILRSGTEAELRRLKAPVLRALARGTDSLAFGGRANKLVADLLAYVSDNSKSGWFSGFADGNLAREVRMVR